MKAIYNNMKFIIKNDFPEIGTYLKKTASSLN